MKTKYTNFSQQRLRRPLFEKNNLTFEEYMDSDLMEDEEDFDDDDLNEEELFEDEDEDEDEVLMSDEDLRIEALKIATNIAKLMQDVLPDDIIRIAESVCLFVRNHQIGQPYDPNMGYGDDESGEDATGAENVVDDESQIEFDDEDVTTPTSK